MPLPVILAFKTLGLLIALRRRETKAAAGHKREGGFARTKPSPPLLFSPALSPCPPLHENAYADDGGEREGDGWWREGGEG